MRLLYLIYIFLLSFLPLCSHGQIKVYSETYSAKNGLAQNDVNDMAKDSCGFLWLATDDGLSRFDGYTFVNHKISTNQFHCSLNNQFEQITIDAFNNVWSRNSMGQVLLYNQADHTSTLYPNPQDNRGSDYIFIREIVNQSNNIWLLGAEKGALRITRAEKGYQSTRFCYNDSTIGSLVNDVFKDNDGNVWLLSNAGIGLLAKDGKSIGATYYHEVGFNVVGGVDLESDIIFSCSNGVIVRYDKVKKRFSDNKLDNAGSLNKVYSINDGNVLLLTNSGYFIYNVNLGKVTKHVALESIERSWLDEQHNIWLVVNNSLFKFNTASGNLTAKGIKLTSSLLASVVASSNKPFPIASIDQNNNLLWLLANDKEQTHLPGTELCRVLDAHDGVYWTKTSSEGVQKNIAVNSTMQFVKCSAPNTSNNLVVSAVCEDNYGRIWVATTDHKIRIFNEDLSFVGYFGSNGQISTQSSVFGKVNTIYLDRKNNIWIGGDLDLYRFSLQAPYHYQSRVFHLEKSTPVGTEIKDILEDKNGHLWLATDGDGLQLLSYNENTYQFLNRRNELKKSYPPTLLKTNCLYEDTNGNVWLGSNEGVTIFSSDFPQLRFLKFFYYNPENSNMTTSVVSGLSQDKEGKIWIASYGGGVMKTASSFDLGDTPEFIAFNRENNKLGTDLVLSVEEDANGHIWVVTEKSIVKFGKPDVDSESFSIVNSLGHYGLGRQIFTRTRGGAFVLGTYGGFYYINPTTLKNVDFIPPLAFTRFQLFNKDIVMDSDDSPIKADINIVDEVVLKHKQNVFSIEYAALDYRNSSGIEYAYKLDNFEENWNYVGSHRVATYTNLPPGDYVFRVKSTNGEGNWCDNDKTVIIHVKPSFWQTGWAWLLYIIIAVCLVGGLIYAYLAFYKMRAKMQFEQEISTMKMQFFTDISHELRTPLTLINAPLENVLQNNALAKEDRAQLEIVHNNTKRMLRMLTQILDFRKLQSNKMRLRVEKTDVFQLVDRCCSNFRKMAESRNINFNVINKSENSIVWVDRDKIDTVMFNLLSNAFKFTPENKQISVYVENENGQCAIRVKDEGCGMPKDKLNLIFDRFATLRPKSLTNQSGTGIGLSLVKEILDLHKAEITVDSLENIGSEFKVLIKPGTAHFDELSADIIVNDNDLPKQDTEDVPTLIDDNVLKLLIVEDNEDLRQFIVSVLSKTYHVIEAANGQDGLEMTISEMPDFVITDIMMPVMDGIEYVRRIRQNEQTSHIPVVLLTAKTDMQSKIECLKIGANDYITKPFSMVYLQARIENIITERRQLQEKYRSALQHTSSSSGFENPGTVHEEQVDKRDDEFMKKVVDYINSHIDQPDLSPEDLANGIKVSRWNLTCKIKSLVGQPPIEFIKEIRLNKAAQLIRQGELSMTQITYMIGMTDSRYFSRCFKQKFGMTPTEYKNQKD